MNKKKYKEFDMSDISNDLWRCYILSVSSMMFLYLLYSEGLVRITYTSLILYSMPLTIIAITLFYDNMNKTKFIIISILVLSLFSLAINQRINPETQDDALIDFSLIYDEIVTQTKYFLSDKVYKCDIYLNGTYFNPNISQHTHWSRTSFFSENMNDADEYFEEYISKIEYKDQYYFTCVKEIKKLGTLVEQ